MPNTLDFLHGVETQEVIAGSRPIQTAKSSIIGILGTAGRGEVNKPVLVAGNPREGAVKFGAYAADGFTIPEALSGIFDQIGAMCVVVNVCDPDRHNTDITDEVVTFGRNFTAKTAKPYISDYSFGSTWSALMSILTDGITLPKGVTLVSVKPAAGGTAYVKDTDYQVAAETADMGAVITKKGTTAYPATGRVLVTYTATVAEGVDFTAVADTGVLTRVSGGKIVSGAAGALSYTYVDPTKVTPADIIGGEDNLGNYIGAEAFLGAEDALELVPRVLIAPHYTHQKANALTSNPVTAKLLAVANEVRAIIYEDGPNTVEEDAVQMRQDWGSDRIMIVDNWFKTLGPDGNERDVPASVYWAGVTAKTDNDIGFWASPSNKVVAGVIGTSRTVDFRMGSTNCRANYLNANQVSCAIRKQGIRTWGNRSCSIDPATSFLTTRRTADMIEESIQAAHLWAVDRVINKTYLEEVLEAVGAYLRHLRQVGAIYGGSAWIDRELNSDDVLADGHIYINYDFTVPKTAEHVTFVATITDRYITNIFQDIQLSLANTSVINVVPIVGNGN